MKKDKRTKKLALEPQTIRTLDTLELKPIAGGYTRPTAPNVGCQTQ